MTVERAPSLDLFRVAAVNCVMFSHCVLLGIDAFPSFRYIVFIFGWLGVELFFERKKQKIMCIVVSVDKLSSREKWRST